MEPRPERYGRIGDEKNGLHENLVQRNVEIRREVVIDHEKAKSTPHASDHRTHSLSLEVAHHALNGPRIDLRLRVRPPRGKYVRTVAQRRVHVAGEHEGGRVLAVNRVERGGIEVHRRVVREDDGVVAGFATVHPNEGNNVSARRNSCSFARLTDET